jgi:transposase
MIRSRLVHSITELKAQGKSISTIARELELSRATVRKYLNGTPPSTARRGRPCGSKLDPFKDQIRQWITDDHLLNCETMFTRLQALGYTGQRSILRAFVHPLRPPQRTAPVPVRRYETKPGDQLQFDWGEFVFERNGMRQKLFGFTAILSYSRMRFVTFTKRCDAPTLIRCLMAACAYFGGLARTVLTDRMKTVLLKMDHHTPVWHSLFGDFVAALGIAPRVCRAYTPQTKGKVERTVSVVKSSFWPGVRFTDLADLNTQARAWCQARNQRVHRTTGEVPMVRAAAEDLRPLPSGWAWERWATEARKVSWDGFVSYDGVLYGVPAAAQVVGQEVQVRVVAEHVTVWSAGQLILSVPQRAAFGTIVPHLAQWTGVPAAATLHLAHQGLGHQVSTPTVVVRPLAEYDRLCGVEVRS